MYENMFEQSWNDERMILTYLIPINPKMLCSCKLKLEFKIIICPVVENTDTVVNLTRKKILKYHEGRRTIVH